MDIDDDGNDDILTGSYWPGDIYLIKGKGDGLYAAPVILKDESDANVNGGPAWKTKDEPEMDSLAAAPHLADLDDDGDFDLLIGNISGRVILIKNEGTEVEPKFSTQKRALRAAGEDIRVGGDAGPITFDWNEDGLLDLIVGDGEGAVWYFENLEGHQCTFAKGVQLIEGATPIDWEHPPLDGTIPGRSGSRAKVHVADYNGDGLNDLLVGDFQSQQTPEPELNAEQKTQLTELEKQRDLISEKISTLSQSGAKNDSPEMQELYTQNSKVWEQLRPLTPQSMAHGFVWFYARKSPAAAIITTSTGSSAGSGSKE